MQLYILTSMANRRVAPPSLKLLDPVQGLLSNCSSEVNANERIMARYLEEVVPSITVEGIDDGHYGPAATSDVNVLQVGMSFPLFRVLAAA